MKIFVTSAEDWSLWKKVHFEVTLHFIWYLKQVITVDQFISVSFVPFLSQLLPSMASEDATKRLSSKKQTLDDAYAAPANFLEIDVINPITHGIGNKRYTDYEVRMKVTKINGISKDRSINARISIFLQTNLPVFRVKESSVRRRYSDFEWLRNELERDSKVSKCQ